MISVLYVDDERDLLKIGKKVLERCGEFVVTITPDTSKAIDLLNANSFDVIISDYLMPKMDGIVFLKYLKSQRNETPFILFTGRGSESVVIEALNSGAVYYQQKGGEPKEQFEELADKITSVVNHIRKEKLTVSADQYRNIFENSIAGLFKTTPDGHIFIANNAFARMYGYCNGEEFIQAGVKVGQLYANLHDREEILHVLTKNGSVENFETLQLKQNGSPFWASISARTIRNPDGTPKFFEGTIFDTTTRKRAEELLRTSEERYRLIFEYSPIGLISFDINGFINSCNDKFIEIIGSSRESLIGLNMLKLPDKKIVSAVQNALNGNLGLYDDDYCSVTGKKSTSVRGVFAPMNIGGRHIVGGVGIIEDISERKRVGEALNAANHKLRLLTGLTRHDNMNLLFALQGYLDLAAEATDLALNHQYIAQAHQASDRMIEMIEFTREYENLGIVPSGWYLLHQMVDSGENEVSLGNVIVENQIPQDLEVYADPIIKKVFSTLIENAIRHGEKITQIIVSCTESEKALIISFVDDGVGIPSDEKKYIFNHGFGKHTGIGLFLAREILSITGLFIRETGVYGKGAQFEVIVPIGKFRRTQ